MIEERVVFGLGQAHCPSCALSSDSMIISSCGYFAVCNLFCVLLNTPSPPPPPPLAPALFHPIPVQNDDAERFC